MQSLKILVVFLAFTHHDCLHIKEVATEITDENLHVKIVHRKALPGPRRIRGFVGGPSDPSVAHHMAINVSEHIKQVMVM